MKSNGKDLRHVFTMEQFWHTVQDRDIVSMKLMTSNEFDGHLRWYKQLNSATRKNAYQISQQNYHRLMFIIHDHYLTVVRRSSATWQSCWLDERERQSRQMCSVSRCTRHELWTAETRYQCPHLWWSAALNFLTHKTPSIHSNSTLNHWCRNNSSHCSPGNIGIPRLLLRRS